MLSPSSQYRLGVGIMLINNDKKIFVGERVDYKESWNMPQGGIDEGEDTKDAALRELYEETNIKDVSIISESKSWYKYDVPCSIVPKWWSGKYIGQKQKWFLLSYNSANENININTSHPEFASWKWVDTKELIEIAPDFKKEIYIKLLKEFKEYLI